VVTGEEGGVQEFEFDAALEGLAHGADAHAESLRWAGVGNGIGGERRDLPLRA
jgi:hypothetical protein